MFERVNPYDLPTTIGFIMVGFPLEATSTGPRAGTKEGPSAIRKAFNYFSLLTELGVDIFQKEIVDIGDIILYPTLVDETIQIIEDKISQILLSNPDEPPIPISLGGDHFITYPIIRSFIKNSVNRIGIIIFDAHVDLYDKWLYKEQYKHCTVFHRVLDLPEIQDNDLLFIGTRDIDYEEVAFLAQNTIRSIPAHVFFDQKLEDLLNPELESFADQGIEEVYISIDIDALDPSIAPGSAYPIPGGLTYRQLWNCLRIITQHVRVVGFDLVEVCPPYDISDLTAITAARIIMEMIGFIIKNMK
ncbi:MAG: agmatinase [Candidatus Helarchaeota archaeon]